MGHPWLCMNILGFERSLCQYSMFPQSFDVPRCPCQPWSCFILLGSHLDIKILPAECILTKTNERNASLRKTVKSMARTGLADMAGNHATIVTITLLSSSMGSDRNRICYPLTTRIPGHLYKQKTRSTTLKPRSNNHLSS